MSSNNETEAEISAGASAAATMEEVDLTDHPPLPPNPVPAPSENEGLGPGVSISTEAALKLSSINLEDINHSGVSSSTMDPVSIALALRSTALSTPGENHVSPVSANVKFAVLIGLIEVGQVSNKDVVNAVLQLVSPKVFHGILSILLSISISCTNEMVCIAIHQTSNALNLKPACIQFLPSSHFSSIQKESINNLILI